MGTSEPTSQPATSGQAGERLPQAAGQAARDRARLRSSEQAVANEVIEFQLARQRVGLVTAETLEPLSPRELEVLTHLAVGRSDGQIAEELFITKKTASVHVANIKGKLGAASRVEIALIGLRLGLVDTASEQLAADAATARSRSAIVCPYKGLASYDAADARYFFGREPLIAEVVARLVGSSFLGIVGPSGSGKSSVLKAGLLPALGDGVLPGSQRWQTAMLRPGVAPLAELRRTLLGALRRAGVEADEASPNEALERLADGTRLFLVVDQFEELFTMCDDEAERAAFVTEIVSLVHDPGARVVVVAVIRADTYGRCAAYRDLADLLGAHHVLVGPMTRDEFARAVDLPARAAGLRIEPELTAALVDDVADQPGGLPMLSTTLLDLWQRREGRTLRLQSYERLGGVSGAVARLAEAMYERLSPAQQVIARGILLRLVAVAEDGSVARRAIGPEAFDAEDDPDVARALEILAESRLITLAEGRVEIAHEALLREWPRLRRWLDEDADDRAVREHLARAATDWDAAGRPPSELYRGPRLASVVEWAERRAARLNRLETSFVEDSRAAAEREFAAERRSNRRLRTLLTAAVGFLGVAVVAAGFAAVQLRRAEGEATRAEAAAASAAEAAQRADQERDRARQAAESARAGELYASAKVSVDEDPALAKLLALAAARHGEPPIEAVSVLHQAVATDRLVDRHDWPTDRFGVLSTDLHPSDRFVVATGVPAPGANETLEVIDLADGSVRWSWTLEDELSGVGFAFFTPDGERVVAGVFRDPGVGPVDASSDRPGVYVRDAETGDVLDFEDVGPCGAIVAAASDTRLLIATAEADACFAEPLEPALELLDPRSGMRERLADVVFFGQILGAITPDGRYAAWDALDAAGPHTIIRDLETGGTIEIEPKAIPVEHGFVRELSPDGSRLLYGDLPVVVVHVDGQAPPVALDTEASGFVWHADFDPAARTAFTIGRDGVLRQWDAGTGRSLLSIPGVGSGRPSSTADGLVLTTRSDTPTAFLFDTRVRGELGTVDARAEAKSSTNHGAGSPNTCLVPAGSLAVNGRYAIFADACGSGFAEWSTRIVDLDERRLHLSLPGGGGQRGALSPDGRRLARQAESGMTMGSIKVHDLLSGTEVQELDGLCSYENGPSSAEGVGECRPFPEEPFPIWASQLRWSPDGSMIVAVDQGNNWAAAVWSVETGRLMSPAFAAPDRFAWDAIFTPDGSSLLVSYEGGLVDVVSVRSWTVERTVEVDGANLLSFIGFAPGGSTLLAASEVATLEATSLHWLDSSSLEARRAPRGRIHEGSTKALTLSPDGALVATGGSDGALRVWDAEDGRLVHEVRLGETEVQGVAFIDAETLAVTSRSDGTLVILTLDPKELLRVAGESLQRGFTQAECERYGFGDACPTLEELAGG